jgi:nitrate reductase gamma subunit
VLPKTKAFLTILLLPILLSGFASSRSHSYGTPGSGLDRSRLADSAACQGCHGNAQVNDWAQQDRTPTHIDPVRYQDTVHSDIDCVACHTDLADEPHKAQEPIACAACHHTILTHVYMGAPHMRTDCAACHMENLAVSYDDPTGRVVLASADSSGTPLDRTDHTIVKEPGCEKCHAAGNSVGAPTSTLPARSILCMLCHDASPTVSVGLLTPTPVKTDYASIIALLVFCAGMAANLGLYLSGQVPGHPGNSTMQKIGHIVTDMARLLFSRRIFRFLGGAIGDGIFQRRVLKESEGRWVIHALIFLPFLARMGLGLLTWLSQAFWPSAGWSQILSDKDTPSVAFTYDFLTALMFLGVLLALCRRFVLRDRKLPNMSQDKIAIGLLGAILLIGVLTEGIRLLSARTPQDMAVYSFLGYALATILRPLNLVWISVYPVIWYAHALLVAAFVAYLPFGKFMHILAGPLIASLDTVRKGKR